jgi:hypothetical protein
LLRRDAIVTNDIAVWIYKKLSPKMSATCTELADGSVPASTDEKRAPKCEG